jgi:hypothetical protein
MDVYFWLPGFPRNTGGSKYGPAVAKALTKRFRIKQDSSRLQLCDAQNKLTGVVRRGIPIS